MRLIGLALTVSAPLLAANAPYVNPWAHVRGVNYVPSYSRNPVQTWVDWALRWVYVKEEEGWLEENFPDEDPDDIRARCTLEVATEACISYAQGDFEEFGLKRGVAREVLVGGWGMAEIVGGSASGGIMMSLLTGLDL